MVSHASNAAGGPADWYTEALEPDYQFDIYRLMRYYNGDDWAFYRPLTNVMVSGQPDYFPLLKDNSGYIIFP
jgi:hypothetical protein